MIKRKHIYILLMVGAADIASTSIGAAPGGETLASGKNEARSHCSSAETVTFSAGSTWHLCYQAVSKYGLIVEGAFFQKSPSSPSVKVLHDARISEIFVPYEVFFPDSLGSPGFYDIADFDFPSLKLSLADCPKGSIIGRGKVCKEFRDRGIAWKDDALVRLGEEVVLWSVLDADNYNYILEWSFHDDGTVVIRAGSTGPKVLGPDDRLGHIHNFTWRLDIDLNGASGDSVYKTKHDWDPHVGSSCGFLLDETTGEVNDPLKPCDSETLVSPEKGIVWNPLQFTTLKIGDSFLVNGNGRPTSYELIPLRTGTARFIEAYTRKDVWVTKYDGTQLLAKDLPTYVNGESVSNADVVVWYTGSVHHESNTRDEDRDTVPVKWIGFELSPQNLFEGTPFYP
ncbi:MAG: hypothetical protein ACREYE_25740 [Gammaproteobacteria bacterium]